MFAKTTVLAIGLAGALAATGAIALQHHFKAAQSLEKQTTQKQSSR